MPIQGNHRIAQFKSQRFAPPAPGFRLGQSVRDLKATIVDRRPATAADLARRAKMLERFQKRS